MEEQKTFRTHCKEGWNRNKEKVGIAIGLGLSVVGGRYLAKNWDCVVKNLNNVLNLNTIRHIPKAVTNSATNTIVEAAQETGRLNMLVLGIVDTTNAKWCQVLVDGRRYTRTVKEIDGELFFKFKNAWHPIAQYVSDHAEVLMDGGQSKPFKNM